MTIALWILAIAMMAVGLVGTVLPILPGAALIFGGAALGAWIDDFSRVSWWTLAVIGVLAAASIAVDFIAASMGAKRLGASPLAVSGATLGTLLGVFTGFWGLLFLPLAGAAIGEFLALRSLRRAGRVGVATGIGLVVGAVVKITLATSMIGVFVAAWLV